MFFWTATTTVLYFSFSFVRISFKHFPFSSLWLHVMVFCFNYEISSWRASDYKAWLFLWPQTGNRITYRNYHHLITGVSVLKRLSLYELALWCRNLVSVLRIRESPYYSGVFFKRKHVRILSGHRKLSLIKRCP